VSVQPKREERIGLLFVHGIGEQKRFEHLRAEAQAFAEIMRDSFPDESFACVVDDRTATWSLPPGDQDLGGASPLTVTLESEAKRLVFLCHESWWADLGARSDIWDSILFWIWGFGQWSAPIYRDLDAAGLGKSDKDKTVDRRDAAAPDPSNGGKPLNKPASQLVKLPESVAGRFRPELFARLQLLLAALATIFTVFGWVVAKRLFSAALKSAPSPTLLVSYVGDVRTYEERAAPGDSALSDPGYPRRVGIRRRMVREMVAMGARRDIDRWYVLAHSQGTVLAYNGLTEIGHALPNYLTRDEWEALPPELMSDPDCLRRPPNEIASMMPGRPAWLGDMDLISRPALFSRLRGIVTYGSPLNKFAALWPRIVATATDRTDGSPFSPDCQWLNLRARQDPVAGDVARFYGVERQDRPTFTDFIPTPVDVDTPFGPDMLISHLRYFEPSETFSHGDAAEQRRTVMRWIMTKDPVSARMQLDTLKSATRVPGPALFLYYLFYIVTLFLASAALITLGGDLLSALFGDSTKLRYGNLCGFLARLADVFVQFGAVSSTLVMLSGYWRWASESRLNLKLSATPDLKNSAALNGIQLGFAIGSFALGTILGAVSWIRGWSACLHVCGSLLTWSLAMIALAGVVQCWVNQWKFKPLRYRNAPPGKATATSSSAGKVSPTAPLVRTDRDPASPSDPRACASHSSSRAGSW
jgi:hypothetical protein